MIEFLHGPFAFDEHDGEHGSGFIAEVLQQVLWEFVLDIDQSDPFGGDTLEEEIEGIADFVFSGVILPGEGEPAINEGFSQGVIASDHERGPVPGMGEGCDEKEDEDEAAHGDQGRSSSSGLS